MNLTERDKQHIWHPLTQHKLHPEAKPIVKAKGALLYDEEGKTYVDAVSSWYTAMYGHCNDFPSLGFVLPKHLGSACKRNLFKRRCRSLFRDMNKERGVINLGLIIKPKSCDIIYPNIRRGFTGLLQELVSK